MFVINATSVSIHIEQLIDWPVAEIYAKTEFANLLQVRTYLANNDTAAWAAFWTTFVACTPLVMLLSKIFTVLWGEPRDVRKLGTDTVEAALARRPW